MSITGKERHTKLLGPELLDSSRLLIRTVKDMGSSTLLTALLFTNWNQMA